MNIDTTPNVNNCYHVYRLLLFLIRGKKGKLYMMKNIMRVLNNSHSLSPSQQFIRYTNYNYFYKGDFLTIDNSEKCW